MILQQISSRSSNQAVEAGGGRVRGRHLPSDLVTQVDPVRPRDQVSGGPLDGGHRLEEFLLDAVAASDV